MNQKGLFICFTCVMKKYFGAKILNFIKFSVAYHRNNMKQEANL